ncbi:MAG: hypothetical protein ABL996_00450 [Micropepsaceae bacterium]
MRSSGLVVGAIVLALAAAGILAATNFLGLDLPFMNPSEQELVAQMNDVAAQGGLAVTFAGSDAEKWQVAPGQKLEKFSLGGGEAAVARLSSTGTIDISSFEWTKLGLSTTLPATFGQRSNGKRVEIGFVARAAQMNPSAEVSVIYATQQAGNSTWRQFRLSPAFELMTFTFDVPPLEEGYTKDPIVVFHSDATGFGRSVELLGVYVKLVPRL